MSQKRHVGTCFLMLVLICCVILSVPVILSVEDSGEDPLSPQLNDESADMLCSGTPCYTCDSIEQLLQDSLLHGVSLGSGFYKEARTAAEGDSLVLKMPHSKAGPYLRERWAAKNGGELLSDAQVREKLIFKFRSERNQMLHWAAMTKVPTVPTVHGSCYNKDMIVTVVGRLRAIVDVTFDDSIKITQRLKIAANALQTVAFWDDIPPFTHSRAETDTISSIKEYQVEGATAFIYGDFDPKQFAVDKDYHVKLVDMDAREWVPYAPKRDGNFGSSIACTTDADCQSHMASFGIDRRLEKGKRPLPKDFSCNTATNKCFGLNGLTNSFAACAILLRPMLTTFYKHTELDLEMNLDLILNQCTHDDPALRWGAQRTEKALRSLVNSFADRSKEDAESVQLPLHLKPKAAGEKLPDLYATVRKSIKKQIIYDIPATLP